MKWLAFVGDVGYQILLKLNEPVNWMRRKLGLGYWSLSSAVKRNVKNAVSFIGEFEKAIVRYAEADHVAGVVCGHIHHPIIRSINGVGYYNCGDWVESCSALVENFDGKIELLENLANAYDSKAIATLAQGENGSDGTERSPIFLPQ